MSLRFLDAADEELVAAIAYYAREAVWDHEPTSVVELLTPQAVIEELGRRRPSPR